MGSADGSGSADAALQPVVSSAMPVTVAKTGGGTKSQTAMQLAAAENSAMVPHTVSMAETEPERAEENRAAGESARRMTGWLKACSDCMRLRQEIRATATAAA